jgi:hypothetical protein
MERLHSRLHWAMNSTKCWPPSSVENRYTKAMIQIIKHDVLPNLFRSQPILVELQGQEEPTGATAWRS